MNPQIIDEVDGIFPVADNVWGKKEVFVNFYMVRNDENTSWTLIDAGLGRSAKKIKAMAEELFGANTKPDAIVLTHGHFDHVGALTDLLKLWKVPVYAHLLELPYLTGLSRYPPADSSVGGGLMASLAFMYPDKPIDLGDRISKLPSDGSVPGLPGWKYIETPGHAPGHISLFRKRDKLLIAGDAFLTTKAESAFYALTFKEQLSGPPKYFTCDWPEAKRSLYKLSSLHPNIVATGHGKPMKGKEMREELDHLVKHFEELAEPTQGRYLQEPAVTNIYGVGSLPARRERLPMVLKVMALSGILLIISSFLVKYLNRERDR